MGARRRLREALRLRLGSTRRRRRLSVRTTSTALLIITVSIDLRVWECVGTVYHHRLRVSQRRTSTGTEGAAAPHAVELGCCA